VGNASSTGFYTHHYAAITHTIDNAPNTVALGANQYGFGPLIIAKTLKIFGLSSYDGIYIGTILANFILGFVLIFLFRSASVPCQVLVGTGFILSISVSFLLNHMFAPMVYTIRYLPSLVLFSYLAFKALQTKPNQNFFSENLTHSLFALFIATYNFEYGILTILAMILVSILHGRIGLSVIYVIAIFTTIAFKAWAGGYETGSSGVNYVGYFSNLWAAGIYDRVLKFITIAAFIPVGWYLVTRTRANKSLEKDSLIILFFLLSIKAGFVGSGNHAGPIFLLVALLSIVFLMQSRTLKTFELRDAAAYTTVAICTLPLLLILLGGRHGLETKLSFETYSKTAISQFQPMSNGLRKKLELSKNIMEKGDIFISPSDSAISLFTQQKITKPFFDLSTNILEKTSYLQIEKSYLDSRAIVVDRLISDSGYRSRNIKTLRSMTVHDHIAPKYWSVIDKFIILWKRIKLQRKDELKLCGENFYFQRYCFKKD